MLACCRALLFLCLRRLQSSHGPASAFGEISHFDPALQLLSMTGDAYSFG